MCTRLAFYMGVAVLPAARSFEYLSTKRDEADKPANSWDRTNEKARFLRVNGLWQFVDYQRYSYNASELTAAAAAPASA